MQIQLPSAQIYGGGIMDKGLQMPVRQFGEECFIAQFDIEKFFSRIPTSLLFDTIGTLKVKYDSVNEHKQSHI